MTVTVMKAVFLKLCPKIVICRVFSNEPFRHSVLINFSHNNTNIDEFLIVVIRFLDRHAPEKSGYIRINEKSVMVSYLN